MQNESDEKDICYLQVILFCFSSLINVRSTQVNLNSRIMAKNIVNNIVLQSNNARNTVKLFNKPIN